MIAERVDFYLKQHDVPYSERPHPRAVTAPQLAHAMHVSGKQVAKSVILRVDDRYWMAVLPANEEVALDKVAQELDAQHVELASEEEFPSLFPGVELGAEPPLGGLWSVPVLMDESLTENSSIIFRAGSHEDAIELRLQDYENLEWPRIGDIRAK